MARALKTLALVFCGLAAASVPSLSLAASGPQINAYWSPQTVRVGEEQTYHWSAQYATHCTSKNGMTLSASGSITLIPTEPISQTSELTCYGPGGATTTKRAFRKVEEAYPPSISASWIPTKVQVGKQQTFYWSAKNATRCKSKNGMELETSGAISVTSDSPLKQTSELTCFGSGQEHTVYAPREVVPADTDPGDPAPEESAVISYDYDALGRLIDIQQSGKKAVSYEYDDADNRISKAVADSP